MNSNVLVLIILAVVIIAGGYLLGYRSGKHRAPRDNKDDEISSKK